MGSTRHHSSPQPEADRASRPAVAGSLPDRFGRVGGAQANLLQDRRSAFGLAPDELNPVGRPGRGLGDDPHELVDRVGDFERPVRRRGPIVASREVGVRRHPGRRVDPDASPCLACDRQSDPPIPVPSRRCSPRAPSAGPLNRRRCRGRRSARPPRLRSVRPVRDAGAASSASEALDRRGGKNTSR